MTHFNRTILFIGWCTILLAIILLAGCDDRLSGDAEVTVCATIDGSRSVSRSESSLWEVPPRYVIGLTYFALEREDGSMVTILDTEEPERFDFSSPVGSLPGLLVGKKIIPKDTYIGYEMRFTYIEMEIESAFSVPDWSDDATHQLVLSSKSGSSMVHSDHTLRMYFNTDGQYWKRDLVVQTAAQTESAEATWAWMHRSV